jgi:hypothetical protein
MAVNRRLFPTTLTTIDEKKTMHIAIMLIVSRLENENIIDGVQDDSLVETSEPLAVAVTS